jgi:hypothetical protein
MKQATVVTIAFFAVLAAHAAGTTDQSRPLASFFPQLQGWRMDGKTEIFLPETLYEHINGAAENFLNYDFMQLAVQNYVKDKKSLSAEIYFHGAPENAFGIYSSEKPRAGDYLTIGGQAYAEAGVLNFVSDAYYVKLNGFGLGPEDEAILTSLAQRIAQAIAGKNGLPKILETFPAAGKLDNSERFILNNFLGHAFLRSAYVADYLVNGQNFQLFIISAGSEEKARAMIEKYAALDKGKPGLEIQSPNGTDAAVQPRKGTDAAVQPVMLTINDPYNGPMRLFWQGKFICGSASQSPAAGALLEEIIKKLAR